MKKAINILLKVSLIVDIIAIVSCVALFIIGIALVPLGVELANELESNSSPEVVITFTLVFSAIFVFPLLAVIISAGSIANIILVRKSIARMQIAKTRSELRGLAIGTLITGALSSNVAIVAGIMMLIVKDRQL